MFSWGSLACSLFFCILLTSISKNHLQNQVLVSVEEFQHPSLTALPEPDKRKHSASITAMLWWRHCRRSKSHKASCWALDLYYHIFTSQTFSRIWNYNYLKVFCCNLRLPADQCLGWKWWRYRRGSQIQGQSSARIIEEVKHPWTSARIRKKKIKKGFLLHFVVLIS